MVTTYTYEAETQRLVGIKTERPAGHASGAKVLQDLRYEYDPVGNVLKISNDAEETRFWRNQKVVPENTYAYGSLYQLVSATGREMANAGQQGSSLPSATVPLPTDSSAFTNYTRTYSYDSAGNLTQIRHSAPATDNSYTTDITVSDKSNRGVLSTLTESPSEVEALFTAAGQQTRLQPGQSLAWTERNELLKVTPMVRDGDTNDEEHYRYNAGSQRILKVSVQKTGNRMQTHRVLYLPGLELRTTKAGETETESLEVITVGEAGRAQVRVLHWESGKPDGISNDQLRYSYDSLNGSSGLELDGDGNIISAEEHYPYGGTAVWSARDHTEADYKTIRYSGKERDATGLYYYGWRYYQPWAGRWLCADLAGTVDGLNLFRMVRNNPVTFVDGNGLMLYHFADPRNVDINNQPAQSGRVVRAQRTHAKIAVNFEVPELSLSGPAKHYLERSRPGNLFSGTVNIRSGEINIYPLSPHRIGEGGPSTNESWKKEYTGEFHKSDGSFKAEPILHDPTTGRGMTSHQQVTRIYQQNEASSIGFSFYDVRSLRAGNDFYQKSASDNTSAIYGRSRSLNEAHFLRVPDDTTSIGDNLSDFKVAQKMQFKDALKKEKTTYSISEMPIEIKAKIIHSFADFARTMPNSNQSKSMLSLFENELKRKENRVETYHEMTKPKTKHYYV